MKYNFYISQDYFEEQNIVNGMKIRLTFTLAAVRTVVNVNVTDSQLNILFKQQMLFHHAFDACMIICWEANLHFKLFFFVQTLKP